MFITFLSTIAFYSVANYTSSSGTFLIFSFQLSKKNKGKSAARKILQHFGLQVLPRLQLISCILKASTDIWFYKIPDAKTDNTPFRLPPNKFAPDFYMPYHEVLGFGTISHHTVHL